MVTQQITIRLAEDLVGLIDRHPGGRARAIEEALREQQRRQRAERDAEIYAQTGDDNMSGFAHWAGNHPVELDDDF